MWASIAAKPPSDGPPPVSVPAAVPAPPVRAAPEPVSDPTPAAEPAPLRRPGRLVVVDTGAIIKGVSLPPLGDSFFTVPDLLHEVRDVEARRRLETLPVELKQRVPSKEALLKVIAFANKTGDFASLSKVDVQVIAITLMLAQENGYTDELRDAPLSQSHVYRPPVRESGAVAVAAAPADATDAACQHPHEPAAVEGETRALAGEEEQVDGEDGEWTVVEDTPSTDAIPSGPNDLLPPASAEVAAVKQTPGWGTDEWVSSAEDVARLSSQAAVLQGDGGAPESRDGVFCLTSDFAMQNVLLQMGLRVLSVEGKRITRVKQWALRCFGCFKITRDMTKVFCPACGNNTLKRVSISVDASGSVMAFLNPKYKISTRGTRYTPPKPTGGRGPKFITDEAQLPKPKVRSTKNMGVDEYVFGDPRNRPAEKPKVEFGGRNPNDKKKKKKRNKNKVVG